jgi:hypothetical protein
MKMHIFNIGSSSFQDDQLLSTRLQACMKEVASVLRTATQLADITVSIYLWPECYQESSSNASWLAFRLPNMPVVWSGLEPLKSIPGINSISIQAGVAVHQEWIVNDHVLATNA